MLRSGALLLVVMSPLFGGWVASGDGDGRWSAGEGKRVFAAPNAVSFDAVARVVDRRATHAVLTLRLPDADGVLTLVVDGEGRMDADDRRVRLQYDEYAADGRVLFRAGRVVGRVWVDRTRDSVAGELAVRLYDEANPEVWRELDRLDFDLESPDVEPEPDRGGDHVDVHYHDDHDTGCDSGWDDGYEDDDGYGGGSGGGCEGDDFDSGDDSGGGCEGDDLDGGGGSSCEGDAIAAGTAGCRTRRSPWIMRAMSWLPYFAMAGFIGVMRRRWL